MSTTRPGAFPNAMWRPSIAALAVPAALLGWIVGSGLGIAEIGFPTRGMVVFLEVAWVPLLLLAMRARWLARTLEATDVVTTGTRLQTVAIFGVVGFLLPLAALEWTPGLRLQPLAPPPGRLVHAFAAQGLDGDMEIYLFRGGAPPLRLTESPGADVQPALSLDGRMVVFASERDGDWDLYVLSIADPSSVSQLTNAPRSDLEPVWSPDGSQVAFASDRAGDWDLWTIRLDGSRTRNLTEDPAHDETAPSWSPDGGHIALARSEGVASDVWIWPLHGGEPMNVTRGVAGWTTGPVWSSDGTKLALTGWGMGDGDVYTIGVDGSGLRRLTDEPSDEWAGGWFDADRFIWLISNEPEFGFNFAYYVPSEGGEPVLYLRG